MTSSLRAKLRSQSRVSRQFSAIDARLGFVAEVRMIGRDGVAAGAIYPKSLFESACYKPGCSLQS